MLIPYNNIHPNVHDSVFIAPGSYIIGDTTVGANSTIWFGAVLRGDENSITIGEKTSIQDNVTIHQSADTPVIVGDEVTVGHNAVIHGCKIGNRCIIGMGSTIMDNVEIGEECIIGANTLIPPGKKIPPRSLVMGSPGKVVKEITEKHEDLIQLSIDTYVQKGIEYMNLVK